MKIRLAYLLFLAACSPAIASITGIIVDSDGQGLADSTVQWGATQTRSAADGSFTIDAEGPGRLRIDHRGYAPKLIDLNASRSSLGRITLKRPNFIFLLSDDQGWVQTSTQMDPEDPRTQSDYFRTPRIDSFFASGMRFVRGYAPGTYCMPTRRSIQVSHSPLRHAFNGRPVPEWTAAYKQLPTIPRALKAADPNYRAAHFGKWDMRYDDLDPAELGYDASDGATGNGEGNVGAYVNGKLDKVTVQPAEDPKNIFYLTNRGSDFMEQQVNAGRPFYLQLSHYALHLSILYRQESYDAVKEWPIGEKHYLPSFAAMLKDMDDGFGQLFDKVRELGIEDHTYIIYMADNGGRPTLDLSDGSSRERRNEPLSVGKHSIYEGGIRVPFGIAGPGIEPGSFSRTPVSGMDILPTLADLVGSDVDLGDIDGGSFGPLVFQQSDTVKRPNPYQLFHDKGGSSKTSAKSGDSETALMQGDYKLIKTWRNGAQHTVELYDVPKDPGEANNLAPSMPERTARMGKLMDEYIARWQGDVSINDDDWTAGEE